MLYREAHTLLEEIADATLDGTRKDFLAELTTVPLLIIDDLGMRKLPHTAAEDLLEVIMRRYERASTLLTSNRPVDDWGSCSATRPPSPRCSIGCCTTRTYSNAGHAAGGRRSTPTCARRRPEVELTGLGRRRKLPVLPRRQIAGFQLSTEG